MDFTSKHFEIIDLHNLTCDSQYNVETDAEIINRSFLEGLSAEIYRETLNQEKEQNK